MRELAPYVVNELDRLLRCGASGDGGREEKEEEEEEEEEKKKKKKKTKSQENEEWQHDKQQQQQQQQQQSIEVLDLACGDGCPSLEIAAHRDNWNVVGVDIDASAIALACDRASELGMHSPKVSFIVCDAKDLTLPTTPTPPPPPPSNDKSAAVAAAAATATATATAAVDWNKRFAAAVCMNGLQYTGEFAGETLRSLAAVLQPGAPLVLVVWGHREKTTLLSLPMFVARVVSGEEEEKEEKEEQKDGVGGGGGEGGGGGGGANDPFAFADPSHLVEELLPLAGFEDVDILTGGGTICFEGGLDEYWAWCCTAVGSETEASLRDPVVASKARSWLQEHFFSGESGDSTTTTTTTTITASSSSSGCDVTTNTDPVRLQTEFHIITARRKRQHRKPL